MDSSSVGPPGLPPAGSSRLGSALRASAPPSSSLVSLFLSVRRRARRVLPLALAAVLAGGVVWHAARPLPDVAFGGYAAVLGLLIGLRAWRRTDRLHQSAWLDIEIGVLLVVAALAAIVHVDRSLTGPHHAVVYVAVGIVSALAHPLAATAVVAVATGLEAAVAEVAYGGVSSGTLAVHAGFALAFVLLNALSLRLEVARLRRAATRELAAERDRIRQEARSYRLLRAPTGAREHAASGRRDDIERLLCSGVEEIQLSVLFALRLLRQCLQVHTAMLLWLDDDGERLRINELVSEDPDLAEGPFAAGDGIIGAALRQGGPVCVSSLKPSYALPHYRHGCPVQAVCAVPVREAVPGEAQGAGPIRGVLLVDRLQDRAFEPADLVLVEQAARFIARTVENERVFVQLERTKDEQGKLYRAAEALGAALSEQDVVDAGVSSARDIATVDWAAFTAFDDRDGDDTACHQIRAVSGENADALLGRRFGNNRGLVSMALRNRHPLPYRGDYDASQQLVFDRGVRPPPMPSLLVLPLFTRDQPLGTLVLGSWVPHAFHAGVRSMLEVLASHMAVSLQNARMVRRLEEQATTDGLTGLLNKRALLLTAEEKLSAAKRFGRQLSVLVTDIDHFKQVNDTHGHDVGDVVIQELARVHDRERRTTDAVARFGGEEFVVICEETDAEGALLLAERIRTEFAKQVFHANGKEIRCTCSVGIATYPEAGVAWPDLFKAADEALYVSKRGGRNRATIYTRGKSAA